MFVKYFLPFIQWYGLMIFIALAIDYFLHRMNLVYVGRYLGFVGTLVIIVSFIYSLRKRKIIESGSPKQLLLLHEYLAWAGSVLILIHAVLNRGEQCEWILIRLRAAIESSSALVLLTRLCIHLFIYSK